MARTKSGERQKREAAKNNGPDQGAEFEIESLANKRGEGKTLQYYVKWKVRRRFFTKSCEYKNRTTNKMTIYFTGPSRRRYGHFILFFETLSFSSVG